MPEPQVGQSAPASQNMDPEEGMVVVVVEEGAMDHHNYSETVTVNPSPPPPQAKAEFCQLVVEEEETLREVQGCRFMEVSKVVQLLTESRWALECVPPGLKEYVYFVVNNERNIRRRSKKKRSDFPDDCGVWLSGSGSTPRSTLMVMPDGELKQVFLRQGHYHTERVTRRRKEYVPVVPQPSPDTLLELHRYYVSLKMDTSYRKRVSWLGPGGRGGHGPLAVVEYIGKFPGFSPHGKASGAKEYVRPAPCLQEDMAGLLQEGLSPSAVHRQLMQRYQHLHGLRDVRQVRDSRRRFLRQQQEAETPQALDPALSGDSLARLLEMVQEGDPLVRAGWYLPGRLASVALCTDDQLRDIRFLCLPGHTLLGVDRRLAVCGLTATPTGYRQLALRRREDELPPVFLGPLLLHQGPDLGEYAAFFSHLKVLLVQADTPQLVVGTEDVQALAQGVHLALPGAAHTVLSTHLALTAADWLKNDGLWEDDLRRAMHQVAGPEGLLAAPNSTALQHHGEQLLQQWGGVAPGFSVHLSTQLLPLLHSKVQEPTRVRQLERVWTDAAQDSVTQLLGETVDWSSQSLLDFVEVVQQVAERQAQDLVRAMLGEGPYLLAPQVAKYSMSRVAWESLTPQQQQETQDRLMEHLSEGVGSHASPPIVYKEEPPSPPQPLVMQGARASSPSQKKEESCPTREENVPDTTSPHTQPAIPSPTHHQTVFTPNSIDHTTHTTPPPIVTCTVSTPTPQASTTSAHNIPSLPRRKIVVSTFQELNSSETGNSATAAAPFPQTKATSTPSHTPPTTRHKRKGRPPTFSKHATTTTSPSKRKWKQLP